MLVFFFNLESPYSAITFETCKSVLKPVATTSRTKNLWMQFQSDGNHTAKGFRIPFVTYNGVKFFSRTTSASNFC
jgi:hypothetical protein